MDAKQLEGELRRFAESNLDDGIDTPLEAIAQAADELERLSAENAELREKCDNQRRELKRFNEITDEDSIEILNLRLKLEAYERVIAEIAQDRDKASELFDKCADECERAAWSEREDACSYHLELFRNAGWEES